jgi:hypothetical protein
MPPEEVGKTILRGSSIDDLTEVLGMWKMDFYSHLERAIYVPYDQFSGKKHFLLNRSESYI